MGGGRDVYGVAHVPNGIHILSVRILFVDMIIVYLPHPEENVDFVYCLRLVNKCFLNE